MGQTYNLNLFLLLMFHTCILPVPYATATKHYHFTTHRIHVYNGLSSPSGHPSNEQESSASCLLDAQLLFITLSSMDINFSEECKAELGITFASSDAESSGFMETSPVCLYEEPTPTSTVPLQLSHGSNWDYMNDINNFKEEEINAGLSHLLPCL